MVAIKNVMRINVITANSDTNLYEISKIMTNNKIGSVIILDNNKASGIVTERDIVNSIANKKNLEKLKVKDLKKPNLITVSSSDDLLDVTRKMAKNGFKRMPVVDNGKLVGIISEKEILLSAPELIEVLSEKLKHRLDKVVEPYQEISGLCEYCENYSDNLNHVSGRWYCENCKEK